MLRPQVVADLELKRFGYDPIPLDPPFATFAADGTPILFHNDDAKAHESVARVSPQRRRGDARVRRDDGARRRRPAPDDAAPAAGARLASTRATCSSCCARPAAPPACARRGLQELYRVMTMSVGDLLDDWFENDALKGAYASTGVVGVWAGPRTPGTAYNLLHHELGELDGVGGAWGHVQGRDGGDLRGDRGLAPAPSARTSAPTRRSRRSTSPAAACTGVTLAERRGDQRADRALRRAPEDDGARPRRRRALPRRGRRRHASATARAAAP